MIQLTPELDSHHKLKALIVIYNKTIERGDEALFPEDYPAAKVHEHVLAHLASIGLRQGAGSEHKSAVSVLRDTLGEVRVGLMHYQDLVDCRHPLGSGKRASFFLAGVKEPSEGQRLAAMIAGTKQHGLGLLPAAWPLERLEQLANDLAVESERLRKAGNLAEGAASSREQLGAITRGIKQRLTSGLRGYYGRDNPVLAEYGLKPRSPRKSTRRRGERKAPSQPVAINGA